MSFEMMKQEIHKPRRFDNPKEKGLLRQFHKKVKATSAMTFAPTPLKVYIFAGR